MFKPLFLRIPLLLLLSVNTVDVHAEPAVMATIKPLQFIAAAIMDGVGVPEVLIPASQSPHHFTLRPSDVRKIADAQLLIWVGPQLETYLGNLFSQLSTETVLIEVGALRGMTILDVAQDAVPHQHENSDDHGLYDPHVWLNTENALLIAQSLHQHLIVMDSENRVLYDNNLARFAEGIRLLEARLHSDTAALADGRYALYHNGIQYFERQFGLNHQFVLVPDHEIQPGIRHLLALRELLEVRPLGCLLEDVNANEATINTVFRDYPVNRTRIDTMGYAIATDRYAYFRLVENLVLALRHCLGR